MPGIEALSRLGCQYSGAVFLDIIPDNRDSLRCHFQQTSATKRKYIYICWDLW